MIKPLTGLASSVPFAGAGLSSHNSDGQSASSRCEGARLSLLRRKCVAAFAAAVLLPAAAFCSGAPTLLPAWNRQSPATIPPARFGNTMAYDSAQGQIVMFGGFINSGDANDTWLWNGTNWTQANPATSPSARSNQTMVYDSARGQVVMFGGSKLPSGRLNDTWLWNGTNWTQASLSTNPPARSSAAMAFDAATGQVVLFGGIDSSNADLGDTWLWNGTSWTQASPAASPSARFGASMAYDASLGEVILFGGDAGGTDQNDTWAWNGSNWAQLTPANIPGARDSAAAAYDDALGEIVLFGGVNNSTNTYLNDTWVWSGSNWTQQTTGSSPGARSNSAMAYDAALNHVVMMGGYLNTSVTVTYADTWSWSPPQNFGSINVCPGGQTSPAPCNSTFVLTYNITTTTDFGTPQVVTQGASGLDFSAAGGTCTGTITAPATCTVNVVFAPQAPGLRLGAVELFSSTNSTTPLVSSLIYGVGQAPLLFFGWMPGASPDNGQYNADFTLSDPEGSAVDAAGDIFIANTSGNNVVKLGAASSGVSNVGSGLNFPESVAVDGAGDVFIGQYGPNAVEVPAGCTVQSCQINLGTLSAATSVAVDAAGDAFIGDQSLQEVVEVPANNQSSQTVVYNPGGQFEPGGMAVDAAGDLFIADYGEGKVLELPAGGGAPVSVGSGWNSPRGVALDAAGDLYVADYGLKQVVEIPAGCTSGSCQMVAVSSSQLGQGNNFDPFNVMLDGQGNIYVADYGDSYFYEFQQQHWGFSVFGNLTPIEVGSASAPQSIVFQNIGNQTLNSIYLSNIFTGLYNGDPLDFVQVFGKSALPDCGATFSIAPGAACDFSISFEPQSVPSFGNGEIVGALQVTDNSLNTSPYANQTSEMIGYAQAATGATYTLGLTASGAGSGSVTSADGSLNCSISYGSASGVCSRIYAGGTSLALTASPAPGYQFDGWSGACASAGRNLTCNVTMTQAQNVFATFNPLGNFGSVNVCPSGVEAGCIGGTFAVAINVPASTTVSSVDVVTQGANNLDFSAGAGGDCPGFVGPGTCIENVNFGPTAPGLRMGAVELLDSGGNVLVTQPISGTGTGAEATFLPYTQTIEPLSNANYPVGVALDGAGNLYIANYGSPSHPGYVVKITPGGVESTVLSAYTSAPGTSPAPIGVAVDGAGNLYVADLYLSYAVKVAPNGVQTTVGSGLGGYTTGIALDGSGDVFIADQGNDRVVEVTPAGVQTTVPATGLRQPWGVATDAAGDVFIADGDSTQGISPQVIEVTPGGVQTTVPTTGLSRPYHLAVDAAGEVIIDDSLNGQVVEVSSGGAQTTLVGGLGFPSGLTLDPAGDLFIGDQGNQQVYEVNRSQGPTLDFGTVNVGGRSADIGISIQNIGNQTLVGTLGPASNANFAEDLINSTCTSVSGIDLSPSASCVEGFYAQPQTPGVLSGSAPVSDSSLNGSPSLQFVFLSATGQSTGSSYTLNVGDQGEGPGTVTDNLSQISCTVGGGTSGACSATYTGGTQVTLTATPTATSKFLGWGGACVSSGTSPTCTVTMNAMLLVYASFVQQDFPTANVCPNGTSNPAPCSSSQPVVFNFATQTTIGSIAVVTQGASGLDFAQGSGSTCTGTIAAGSSCQVNVNFTPLAPGLRTGAVELYDASGNLIASTPVYGVGQGPVAAFSPAAQAQVSTGSFTLKQPNGVTLDAAGDLFIGDTGNARVLEITASGVVKTVGVGLQYPQGMAVDGAGDLYIADNNLNQVVEVPAGCASAGCQINVPNPLGLKSQLEVALDGAGDLFVDDYLDGRVAKIPANGGAQTIVYQPTPGCTVSPCSAPVGLAVDAAGDLFIADLGLKKVVELPAGCANSNCGVAVGPAFVSPQTVAVDAAGDVIVADNGFAPGGAVLEVPPGCISNSCLVTIQNQADSLAATVDSAGDVFFGNNAAGKIIEVTRSLPPAVNFAVANVGSLSPTSPQVVSVQNVGTQPLSVSAGATSTASFSEPSIGSACGAVTPSSLASGAFCYEAFSFTPQITGIITDSATFTDNTMNLSSSVSLQTVKLNGIGSLNGATGTAVPNVVGMTTAAATTALTQAGLTLGTVGTGYSSSEPQGSVFGESPQAGMPVNLGSAVNLMVATGQAPAPSPDPLTFENNYFVTGDYATGGVYLHTSSPGTGVASGTITIPDLTTCGCGQGVPDGADLVDGFLYWTTLETTATPSGSSGTFLGYPITGQQIGNDIPDFNDGSNTGTLRVYRADVNNYFQTQPNWNGERLGSGSFAVSLPDSAGTGNGFTITEGAGLVVIYRALSPNVALKSIVIYDGSVVPTTSSAQSVQGFYDAKGPSGNITTFSAAAGNWTISNSSAVLAAHATQYSVPLSANNAYAAVILSTPVTDSDNDGILDAWKSGPAAPSFFAGQPGYFDVKTQSWVALPGAKHGEKDLFVQLDYMCGSVLSNGECDPTQENLFPSPDVNGNDPLAMVQQSFANSGITLHLEVGNAVAENECTDSTGQPLCEFPGEPGVIAWKNSLELSKLWPRNYSSCVAGGDCTARFPVGQKDSYHYVLFGHSLAIPAWNTRFGTLVSLSANNATGLTTIVTPSRGPQILPNGVTNINYCPSRFTISGVIGNSNVNGTYNTSSCPDSQTIVLSTPGIPTWSYPNSTMPEPDLGLTSGTVTSISGYSDLGGADSAVTLALWETDPQQNMGERAQVIAGTLFHEIGHTIGLTHGGLYYQGGTGSYVPTFDINCKPNYQSSMNYLFQLDGVGPNQAVAYSSQTLQTLTEASLGSVANLLDTGSNLAAYSTSAWYASSAPTGSTETQATLHCDGTPLNSGEQAYFVEGTVDPVNPTWQANQDITFDGQQPGSTGLPGLVGYNDIANIDLRQVGATGGELASLANVLSFGSSSTPQSVDSGGTATLGAGGTVTLGVGGSLTLVNGGAVTVGAGAVVSGGGTITFGTTGSATLSSSGTVTPGANGPITFASGDMVTLTSTGIFTLGSGGTVTLGGGGTVTLGGGGTVTLGGGGTVTIPAAGGTYDIPSGGGTVTLGGGGTVTLGGGGTVTLGGGGTVTLGGGGTVTLGGGGTVTLGGGGTVTLGGGGTVTLGGGGTVTLGAGGTVTLGGGGTVTLGGGGTVTLGGGGTVTLGGGGAATPGSGGTVTLGAGGTVTLGAGGTVTLGAGGTVTLGGGGTVTLGGGGTVTLGGGGTVTLGGGGTSTITVGGIVVGTCSGSCSVPAGGTVTLGGGGTVTLGGGGTVTLGGGGTVTLGGGGTVTLGGGGVVTLGAGGTVTLGGGGTVTLGGGGTVTLGGGGAETAELDYNTANSVVRPPGAPTYSITPATMSTPESVQVNWTAPPFGVVQTYTVSRSVIVPPSTTPTTPVVIGSVSGVYSGGGYTAPATTFTDTNPPAGTLIYTITTTLVPDTTGSTPRQSAPSPPAVLTLGQTIVLGPLPSSVVLGSTQPTTITVTATAMSNNAPNMQLVSFSASGQCSAGSSTVDTATGISSATITLNSTGSCTITASQAGNSTTAATGATAYSAATPVSGTFTILPQGSNTQSQTITFGPAPSAQYGSGFSVSATSSSGMPVSFSASGPCSVGATTGTATGTTSGAGLCRITARVPASNNFSAASVSQSFVIATAPLTVTANPITVLIGQPIPPLTYTFGPLVNGDSLATAVSGMPALTTTATALSGAGTYPILVSTGSLAAANYSFLYVPGVLTIMPGTTNTSLTSSTGGTSNYGQLVTFNPTVTAAVAPPGTDSVIYSYTNPSINNGATVMLGSVPLNGGGYSTFLLPTGTNTITATFDGDGSDPNYQSSSASATQVVASVPVVYINPASVTFPNTDVGSTSASISVVLTNIGTASLNINNVQLVSGSAGTSDFVIQSSTCGSSLPPGPPPLGPPAVAWGFAAPSATRPTPGTPGSTVAVDSSCTVTLAFAPQASQYVGLRTGTLVFTDNDGGQAGASDYIALTGSALSAISAQFPMPPVQTIPAGDYIWFNSEMSVQGPLDPYGNALDMSSDVVQVMVTSGSISFTNPSTGTTTTIPVPDALIQFVPGLAQASTTFDSTNNRWVTQVPMSDPATRRSQFVMPGNIFVTGIPYLVPAAISQTLHGGQGVQNITWSAEYTTDTPGVSLSWQWGAAVYNSCFGNQPTGSNPNCTGDPLSLANVDVLGINSADPEKCPIAHQNSYNAGTPYNFINDLVVNGMPGPKSGSPNLFTGNPSQMAGVVPAVTPVNFSPSPLVFMPVNAGQSSTPMTLTITNTNQSLPLNISGVALRGSNSGDFAITATTCSSAKGATSVTSSSTGALTLAPVSGGSASSCTFTVVFTPTDLGTRTSSLVFTYATPAGMAANETPPPQNVDLYGTGAGGPNPIVGLSSVSLTFPHQEQGTTSASQTVVLVNAGGGPLIINSIAPSGQYGATNTCPSAPSSLASGSSCTISVWFQPLGKSLGTQTGAITITDNNNGVSGSTQTISLTGQASP